MDLFGNDVCVYDLIDISYNNLIKNFLWRIKGLFK